MCVCMYIIFVLFLMCQNSGSYTDGPKKQQSDTTLEKKLAILNLLRGEIVPFFYGQCRVLFRSNSDSILADSRN